MRAPSLLAALFTAVAVAATAAVAQPAQPVSRRRGHA
jgi:hypothetical protein